MKNKRGIAKRKPKLASTTKKGNPNIASVNTQDECNLDDYNNKEVNGSSEIEPPQKSNQQNLLEKIQNQEILEPAFGDSTSSFPGVNTAVSTSLLKKARSKTNKSSKALSSSSTKQIIIAGNMQTGQDLPNQDPKNKEEELKVALEVIRKVMKMDAAEPFNVPVDPVALGIPDYFDVIKTPMDFGTICYNIENGLKYKNSKDVMKDVQYIWDNCCKYNRKGHFILELMKRVKKNFAKYWTEAGLCEEQQIEIDEETSFPASKPTTSSNIYGNRNPLASLANCARSLQQDKEDLTIHQLDHHSLVHNELYKSQQRPGHYQLGNADATMRQNPRESSVNPLDYGFSHPRPRQNPHEIPHSHSSFGRNEPYQPQQRPCQCHPSPLNPQHSYHHASARHRPTTLVTEPTVRSSPYGHWGLDSHHAESSRFSHQNKISHQPEYHSHQSSLCYNQPYRYQRDFCSCFHCSGHADEDFDSHRSEHWNLNSIKPGPRNSKQPMTDFTSHGPHDQIGLNRLYKQQPTETCGVEKHFSPPPSESLVTVAKHGTAKYPPVSVRETINHERLDEINQNQTEPDKPDEPLMEISPGQSSSQPEISPLQDLSDMFQAVSNKSMKRSGFRGPTRCRKLFETEDKIPITTNEDGEPIGPETPKLVSFLGIIARNGHLAPLNYVKWKTLPEEKREKMWELVQSKFEINPESKFWALKSLAKKWSTWKALLKVNHYNPHDNDEARLADCNERVLPEQWRALIEFWNSPEAQEVSNKNKANRSHMKLIHAAGSKSFARLREEQRLKRPDGKEPSEADLFILTRTKKNGQPVTETSSTIISQLRDAAQQNQGTSQVENIENEVFVQVMGEDKRKRKRKRGPNKKLCPAPLNTLLPEAEKIVLEAKAEVLEMKEKMVAVEQTCAQMAAQMAAMVSMMQKNFADNNSSNLVVSVNPEESGDVSASQNGFQTHKRSATKNGKKHGGKVARTKP